MRIRKARPQGSRRIRGEITLSPRITPSGGNVYTWTPDWARKGSSR